MHPDKLQQQIRFAISQLSPQNDTDGFEKVCLFFSRARIHLNILAATGPVQAGGDQGRDFETFHSYMANSPISGSSFLGQSSAGPVAFACSLQKDPAKKNGKVYNDVKTIMSSGSKVERIYFFSGEDVPVSKRHKAQESVRLEFSVELEIIDAQTLSQQLADADIFWIAVQYLKIPSDFSPARKDSEHWYFKLLEEYKSRDKAAVTFEEFAEIKSAARHIYKNAELKSDLIFWHARLDNIITNPSLVTALRRKAIYEKFVTALIGLNNIHGQEKDLQYFFDGFEKYDALSELADTQFLLSFCRSSKSILGHDLSEEYLSDLTQRLEDKILQKLAVTANCDAICALLEMHAHLLFTDSRKMADGKGRVERYISKLNEMVDLLPDTSYYPVDSFAGLLNKMVSDRTIRSFKMEGLDEIVLKVDRIMELKGGKWALAEKLRDRAMGYLENGETFKAIDTLHELKLKWFNEDSLKGSISSCLLLAQAYSKLNMHYASKYYALVAAYLSVNSKKAHLYGLYLKGLSMAADSDYSTGAWLNYIDLVESLIITHYAVTKDFDIYDHDDTHKIFYYPGVIQQCAKVMLPEINSLIETKYTKWGFIKDDIAELIGKTKSPFQNENEDQLIKSLNEDLYGRPFNDIGKVRMVEFNACGCNWKFRFSNDYHTNFICEEFISMFQVILVDLHPEELYIIPANVVVEVRKTNRKEPEFKRLPSMDDILWEISLPIYQGNSYESLSAHQFHYLVIAQALIYEASLLPFERYKKVIDKKLMQGGLASKSSFGQPYAALYKHFVTINDFEGSDRAGFTDRLGKRAYVPRINKMMPWKDSLAPDYNRSISMEAIHNRLRNSGKAISRTLVSLKASAQFTGTVSSLREQGWLDWQIQQNIAILAVNYKARFKKMPASMEEAQRLFFSFFDRNEEEWYSHIPESEFTEHKILGMMDSAMFVTLVPSYGLEFHSEVPNPQGIKQLLAARFRLFEDGKELIVF